MAIPSARITQNTFNLMLPSVIKVSNKCKEYLQASSSCLRQLLEKNGLKGASLAYFSPTCLQNCWQLLEAAE